MNSVNGQEARGKAAHAVSPRHWRSFSLLIACCLLFTANAFAEDLSLQALISEALKNNPDILVSEAKIAVSGYRIPQAKSLPDPMLMIGYQNEGWKRYTYGEMQGAQWMFSASQTLPFPGKLSLKEEMAVRETESLQAAHNALKLQIIAKVKGLYYDLFLSYKNIDIIHEKLELFSRVESAAVARYSSGMGLQQEVLMSQAEKYMLLEKEEMMKQKIQAIEAMLNAVVGRDIISPIKRPAGLINTTYSYKLEDLLRTAYETAPDIKPKEKMAAAAEIKVKMAQKEYYPDFTLSANFFKRSGEFEDMWSLSTAINIPIFYKTKQKPAVLEAEALLSEARHELEAVRIMLASDIKDNYSMIRTAERLIELYKNGLIPKIYQDFEASLAGYAAGKVEAITVISRLKSLFDVEGLYWGQLVEKEKAIARLEAIAGINLNFKEAGND